MELSHIHQKKWKRIIYKSVIHAIQNYAMIEENETVCVALSGGKDSIVLLTILWYLHHYSHLQFSLKAVHVKTDEYDTNCMKKLCSEMDIEYEELTLNRKPIVEHRSICYSCSRLKRGAISRFLKFNKLQKVAFGHNADDIAETFFMNMIHHKKMGSFSPKVEYNNNSMIVVRPLVYLSEKKIISFHDQLKLPILDYQCPFEEKNIRSEFKEYTKKMNSIFKVKDFNHLLIAALENIDETNIWKQQKRCSTIE